MASNFWYLFAAAVFMSAVNTSREEEIQLGKDYDQFVYNPHIIINPPRFSVAAVEAACCNCSTVRHVMAAEMSKLGETYLRLRDDTKAQLKLLQTAVADLARLVQNLPELNGTPDTKTTSSPRPPDEPTTPSTPPPSPTTPSTPPPSPTTPSTPPPSPTTRTNEPFTPAETTQPYDAETTVLTTTATTTPPLPKEPTTPPPPPPPPTTRANDPETTVLPTTITTTTPIAKAIIGGDCSDAEAAGVTTSGVYTIQPRDSGTPIQVYCDLETDGGGWTVFQRRRDGSEDFYRDYDTYRLGFGRPDGEFWLGNGNLHRLTSQGSRAYELRIDLEDFEGNAVFAKYRTFGVSSAEDGYTLSVGTYSGTAGDSLTRHDQKPFTTKDRDNDDFLRGNCASLYHGAWWYERCHQSNLNGNYLGGSTNNYAQGVVWRRWKGYNYSLKTSEMKFRKKSGV